MANEFIGNILPAPNGTKDGSTSPSNIHLLYQIYQTVISGTNPQASFHSAITDLQRILGGDRIAILLKVPDKQVLRVFAAAGYPQSTTDMEIPINEADTGWVLKNQMTLRITQSREASKNQNTNSGSILVIPISYKILNYGVLIIERNTQIEHTSSDEEMLKTICCLLGLVLANNEINNVLEHKELLTAVLSDSINNISSSEENIEIITTASQEIGKSLAANKVQVILGIDEPHLKIESIESNFESTDHISESGQNHISVPITINNHIIGSIISERNSAWTDEEHKFIKTFAAQISRAIENAQLQADKRNLYKREELINEISKKIWSSQSIDLILQTAIKEIGIALAADEAVISLG